MEFSREISLIFYISVFAILAMISNEIEKSITRNNNSLCAVKFCGRYLEINKALLFESIIYLLIPCIVLGFRYGIGSDYSLYKILLRDMVESKTFDYSQYGGISTEIGNYFLAKVTWIIFGDYRGYLISIALITYSCFWKFIKEYHGTCKLYLMTIICLSCFFAPSMNIMRQTMAIAILSLSLKYIFERKPFKFIAIVAIATCFHTSAVVFLPLYLLYTKHQSSIKRFWRFAICFSVPILYNIFQQLLADLPIFSKYLYYENISGTTSYIYVVAKVPVILLIIIMYRELITLDVRNEFYIYLFVIELVASMLSIYMHWAFRFMYYGMIAELVLIPQTVSFVKAGSRKFISALIIIYYIGYFCFFHYIHSDDGIFPYAFSLLG